MNRAVISGCLLVLSLAGCGPEASDAPASSDTNGNDEGAGLSLPRLPGAEELATARAQATEAVRLAHRARIALELLGLFPSYQCGEPRRTFVGQAVEDVRLENPCFTLLAEATTDADLVRVQFPTGCGLGHDLSGEALYRYSGGEERMDMELDLEGLQVSGESLPAKAGYGTCSDEARYWGEARAEIVPGKVSTVTLRVASRDGLPIVGGTTLIVDGQGTLALEPGDASLAMAGLVYELGEYLPKEGVLEVVTANGTRVVVEFQPSLWRFGLARITIDDKSPVTVPIVR